MQINELKAKHYSKRKKRVGRGGKKGTYSGRGIKGQKQRSGRKLEPIIRQLIKRYPKIRGYRRAVLKDYITPVNLEVLEKTCADGEIISPKNLLKKGVIDKIKGKIPKVKILGKGKITKKIIIENCRVSKAVKEAVEKAGGKIK